MSSKHIFLIIVALMLITLLVVPVQAKELKRELIRSHNETVECGHSKFAVFFVNKTAYKIFDNSMCIVKVTYTYNVTYSEIVNNETVIRHKIVNETVWYFNITSHKLVKSKMSRSAEEIFEEIKRITLTMYELLQLKITYVIVGAAGAISSLAISYYIAKRRKEFEIEAGFR